jgi:hypothetical protein
MIFPVRKTFGLSFYRNHKNLSDPKIRGIGPSNPDSCKGLLAEIPVKTIIC